jgi:large subunit ribosomal protein L9
MHVILLEDVKGLGRRGEKVKVAPGHARNFMIPNKLAIPAAGAGARIFQENERQRSRRELKAKHEAEEISKRFADVSIHISVEVGEEDRLFGSVTASDIADHLRQQGIEVDKRRILLEEPLKQLGVYNVPIKLHRDVEPKVKVWVVKKQP